MPKVPRPITIGICAYNEEANIAKLLSNILFEQNLHRLRKIVVVCSGCSDQTPKIVSYFARHDERIKPIVEPKRLGKAAAVNAILDQAEGDLILISADVLPDPGSLARLLSRLDEPEVGVVSAKPVPVNEARGVGSLVNFLWSYHNFQLEHLNDAGLLAHASEVFAIRGEAITRLPSSLVNDDAFLAIAAKRKGFLVKFDRSSVTRIWGPQNLSDYLAQRRRIIVGHHQLKKTTGQPSQYVLHQIMLNPLRTLKTAARYLVEFRSPFVAMAAALIEFMANFGALWDIAIGRSYAVWRVAESTKRGITIEVRASKFFS